MSNVMKEIEEVSIPELQAHLKYVWGLLDRIEEANNKLEVIVSMFNGISVKDGPDKQTTPIASGYVGEFNHQRDSAAFLIERLEGYIIELRRYV